MQKKLIALAVAGLGLTGAAYAQSNVTIYGVVDNTFENVHADGYNTGNRVSANSSYIGFKGEENLGNGLKAKFLFEQGLNTNDTKNSAGAGVMGTASRDAWIALNSDAAGEVRLGTFNRATRTLGSYVDQAWGYSGITTMKGIMGTVAGNKTGADERLANAVGYFSPVIAGGLQLTAAYGTNYTQSTVLNTASQNTANNKAYDFGALYNNGPIKAGVAYARSYNLRGDAPFLGTTSTAEGYAGTIRAGASYTFPTATTVAALWDRTKVQNNTLSTSDSRNAFELAVKQAFGANNVYASFAKSNKLGGSDNGAKQYVVGYNYDLSKRTMLKAYWTKLTNNSAGTTGFYDNSIATVAAGGSSRAIGVGVRHSF